MKKLLLVAILATSLQGCIFQAVDTYDLKLATKWCADKGHVLEMRSLFYGEVLVMCNQKKRDTIGTSYLQKTISQIEREFAGQ